MGDAQSSLIRQQTREVRKKALINYRFLPLGAASRAAPLRRTRRRGAAARRHRGQRTQEAKIHSRETLLHCLILWRNHHCPSTLRRGQKSRLPKRS